MSIAMRVDNICPYTDSYRKGATVMGMTDLQFKSYLRLLLRTLETAVSKESKEEIIAEISRLMHDLEDDLKG